MCEKCDELQLIFDKAERNSTRYYLRAITQINAMVDQGLVELYAGDCPLADVEAILSAEEHYTICHYLRCNGCNKFFFIGICIRGCPVYKSLDELSDKTIKKMLWGRCGTWHEKRKFGFKKRFFNPTTR